MDFRFRGNDCRMGQAYGPNDATNPVGEEDNLPCDVRVSRSHAGRFAAGRIDRESVGRAAVLNPVAQDPLDSIQTIAYTFCGEG